MPTVMTRESLVFLLNKRITSLKRKERGICYKRHKIQFGGQRAKNEKQQLNREEIICGQSCLRRVALREMG